MTKEEKIKKDIIDELNYQCNCSSQNAFAQKAKITRSYIGNFIDGSRDPLGLTIKKLLQLFPGCEIKINGFSNRETTEEQITIELREYIDRLSLQEQQKALDVLKAMFNN